MAEMVKGEISVWVRGNGVCIGKMFDKIRGGECGGVFLVSGGRLKTNRKKGIEKWENVCYNDYMCYRGR